MRPGVPTTTCGFRPICLRFPETRVPPYASAIRTGLCFASRTSSASTCTASSRVGTTTIAWNGWARSRRWMIGRPNAAVLPVPVRAWPMMSAPARATGIIFSWISEGVTK